MLFRRLSSTRATVGILAVCLALTWAAPCSAARVAKPDILRNDPRQDLALHKPYHVYPAPNYSLCTGASDAKDLTDGLFTDGYFWTQQTTVGWQRVVSSTVIIDLGAVQPIRALACRGPVGGRAGVYAIDRVEYYVGDDGDNFYLAGVAENPDLAEDGKELYFHTFAVDNLRAGGRYVMARFYVGSKSAYVFTDEIVVRKGDFDPTGAKPTGKVLRRRDVLLEQQQIRADTFTLAGAPETPHVRWGKPLRVWQLQLRNTNSAPSAATVVRPQSPACR